jgi:hypothetical protein
MVGEDASKILEETSDRFQNGEGALAQKRRIKDVKEGPTTVYIPSVST